MKNKFSYICSRLICCAAFIPALAAAETHVLTLRDAIDLALKENPDMILARLDAQRAEAGVRLAKDPFRPKVYGGSGAAYTYGYPNPIEGSAPSIFEARTDMAIFNRPKSYQLAEARENARTATIDIGAKGDEVAYRTASLFLDARQQVRNAQSMQTEQQALAGVDEAVRLRVEEGRELPLALKQADLNVARAKQRAEAAGSDLDYSEQSLAVVLGFPAGDRVQPVEDETTMIETPESEEASISAALENNKDLRRLESQMLAKRLEVRSQKAERWPQLDLVAQYALFAKYNYEAYFAKFQRNNAQIGVAVRIPLLVGSAPKGAEEQAELDIMKIRTQISDLRNRTELETRRAFQNVKNAGAAREIAKLDLEVAREQVRVLLDQSSEGRATRQAVDSARLTEQEKWIAYYESQNALEKAQLSLLRQTGAIQAALLR